MEGFDEIVKIDCDGIIFSVPLSFAKRCDTLANVIEDTGIANAIPAPEVPQEQLKKMVDFHTNSQWKKIPDDFTFKPYQKQLEEEAPKLSVLMKKKFEPTTWESQFIESLGTGTGILELMMAANYLEMKDLTDFLSHVIMYQRVMGATDRLSSIQDMFGIPRQPMTEEQYKETENDPKHVFIKEEK